MGEQTSHLAFLGDFYTLFEAHGFAVGKLWPRWVDFHAYSLDVDEDFRGPNYVAVRQERSDLIARLS